MLYCNQRSGSCPDGGHFPNNEFARIDEEDIESQWLWWLATEVRVQEQEREEFDWCLGNTFFVS